MPQRVQLAGNGGHMSGRPQVSSTRRRLASTPTTFVMATHGWTAKHDCVRPHIMQPEEDTARTMTSTVELAIRTEVMHVVDIPTFLAIGVCCAGLTSQRGRTLAAETRQPGSSQVGRGEISRFPTPDVGERQHPPPIMVELAGDEVSIFESAFFRTCCWCLGIVCPQLPMIHNDVSSE